MSLFFFFKICSVNVIISNMDGLYVMVGWTNCSSQKTCVHLCVSEGFGLCEVIQDVKFYGLAELDQVQVQSSVDLS
jgi:hypothetical protein